MFDASGKIIDWGGCLRNLDDRWFKTYSYKIGVCDASLLQCGNISRNIVSLEIKFSPPSSRN